MLKTAAIVISAFMVFVVLSGCTSGFLYTNITLPLTVDMNRTPVGHTVTSVNTKRIQEPFTGIDITVEWDSRAIGDAARRAGLETVYFADIHTISFLGGLWEQQAVNVWGK